MMIKEELASPPHPKSEKRCNDVLDERKQGRLTFLFSVPILWALLLVVMDLWIPLEWAEDVPNSVAGWNGGLSSYYATFSL